MRKLRIALFTGNYNHIRDGVSNTLNRLVAHLEKRGFPVLVFGPWTPEPAMKHEGTFEPIYAIPAPGRPEYRIATGFPKKKREILRQFKPDLIHIATPDILGYKALRYAIRHNIPVVSSYHTHFSSYLKYYRLGFMKRLLWKYLHWFYRNCKHLYVPSPAAIDELGREGIQCDMKLWARGVDTDLFHPDKRDLEWRRSLGFTDEQQVIVFVSRLVWEKNLAMVVRAFQTIQNPANSIRTLIVGDGPAKQELSGQLPETVFTGYLNGEDLAKAYASSDIYFFPSDTETFGNVTLEAMSSGLPVVAARAVGNISLVDEEVNGYLADAADHDAFVEYLKSVANSAELRSGLATASRNKAESYEWERILDQLLSYYQELIRPEVQR